MAERHKHADVIISWANGEEIQYFNENLNEWVNIDEPSWYPDYQYRIKPKYRSLNQIDNSTLSEIKVLYTPDKETKATILDTNFKSLYKNLTILAKITIYGLDHLILINRNTGIYKFLDDTISAKSYFVYFPE